MDETPSYNRYCGNCQNFKQGSEKHDPTYLGSLNSDTKDTDRCRHTEYRINEYTFCIVPKMFIAKK